MKPPQHSPRIEPLEGVLRDAVRAIRETAPPPGFGARVLAESATWSHPAAPRSYAPPSSRNPIISLIAASIAASIFFLWFTGDGGKRREEVAKGKTLEIDAIKLSEPTENKPVIAHVTDEDQVAPRERFSEGEMRSTEENRQYYKESGSARLQLEKELLAESEASESLNKAEKKTAAAPMPFKLERSKQDSSLSAQPREEKAEQTQEQAKNPDFRKQLPSRGAAEGRDSTKSQFDDKFAGEQKDEMKRKTEARFSRPPAPSTGSAAKKPAQDGDSMERADKLTDKSNPRKAPSGKEVDGKRESGDGNKLALGATTDSLRASDPQDEKTQAGVGGNPSGGGAPRGFGGGRTMGRDRAERSLKDLPDTDGDSGLGMKPETKSGEAKPRGGAKSEESGEETLERKKLEALDAERPSATSRLKSKSDMDDRSGTPTEENETEAKIAGASAVPERANPKVLSAASPEAPKMRAPANSPEAADAPSATGGIDATEAKGLNKDPGADFDKRFGADFGFGKSEATETAFRYIAVADDTTLLFTTGPAKPIRLGEVVPASHANLLHVIDWSKDEPSRILTEIGSTPLSVAPLGNTLLNSNGVLFAIPEKRVERLAELGDNIQSLAISPEGKEVITQHVDSSGTVTAYFRISDLPSGDKRSDVPNVWAKSFAVGFAPQGNAFAAMDKDRIIREYQLADGAETKSFAPPLAEGVRAIEYSPDSKLLASTSSRGDTFLWNRESAELLYELKIEQSPPEAASSGLTAMRFSPDSKFLAASGASNLFFWSVATGKVAAQLDPGTGGAIYLRYSPDGKSITAITNFERTTLENGQKALRYPAVRTYEVPEAAR